MIYQAEKKDLGCLAKLACLLWEHHNIQELTEEFSELVDGAEAAFYIAAEDGEAVGFAQCQLRHDYVEGTISSPVGYLEGIFVKTEYRHRGLAAQLLNACEEWARLKGCTEFASDCELSNGSSLAFHLNVGVEEANRIICFSKKL